MENIDESTVLKKKRGRRKKVVESIDPPENIEVVIEENIQPEHVAKKRGRKPKGGKLILKQCEPNLQKNIITNVILHLKCSMSDLNEYTDKINKLVTDPLSYNPSIPPDIMTYDESQYSGLKYEKIDYITEENSNQKPISHSNYAYINEQSVLNNICSNCKQLTKNKDEEYQSADNDDDISMKDINSKLKRLKLHLYKNSMPDKKSACFWCTCEFDNPSCYIPKYEMDEDIHGYGSFCRPECATAYLMKENIDDSTKFERYHLLNKIYSKIYDYKKNIKPAPNPYYLLDKFYGNLSIQEYRKLLKTEHMLLVIEKPMTRILPELHEDNEEIVLNVYGGNNKTQNTSGVYKVKRESEKQKGPSKTSIMRNKFGLDK